MEDPTFSRPFVPPPPVRLVTLPEVIFEPKEKLEIPPEPKIDEELLEKIKYREYLTVNIFFKALEIYKGNDIPLKQPFDSKGIIYGTNDQVSETPISDIFSPPQKMELILPSHLPVEEMDLIQKPVVNLGHLVYRLTQLMKRPIPVEYRANFSFEMQTVGDIIVSQNLQIDMQPLRRENLEQVSLTQPNSQESWDRTTWTFVVDYTT